MAIDLSYNNIPQWIKEGRVFHGFGGALTTPEQQPAVDLVRQTPVFFIRVPAGIVIIPLFAQVAPEATTAVCQMLVSSANNDIGTANSTALTPINVNTRYATNASRVSAYATVISTGTGTAPTGVCDYYREYHQADRDAITTTSPTAMPLTYDPRHGYGSWAMIGSENNTHSYMVYYVAGTTGTNTAFHLHSWAEFTYTEMYAV